MAEFDGGCHCGNLRYRYSTGLSPADWPVRRCTCSHCLRFAARYTSAPDSRLELTVLYASMLARYEFGTRTARFLRCSRCGVMVCAIGDGDGRQIAVLNVNTLDAVQSLPLNVADSDFDGEDTAARLARRAANWIPEVQMRFVNA